jgi:phenylalanyl-tRNA synthetase beta chain
MIHNISTLTSKFAVKPVSLFQINLFIKYIEKKFKDATSTSLCNAVEPNKEITFNLKECLDFIKPIDAKKFKSTLRSLGFKILKTSAVVPGYRKDLVNQYDLCEEVIKKLTIDAIDIQPIETTVNVGFNNQDEFFYLNNIRQIMVDNFFVETKTYNLTSKEAITR